MAGIFTSVDCRLVSLIVWNPILPTWYRLTGYPKDCRKLFLRNILFMPQTPDFISNIQIHFYTSSNHSNLFLSFTERCASFYCSIYQIFMTGSTTHWVRFPHAAIEIQAAYFFSFFTFDTFYFLHYNDIKLKKFSHIMQIWEKNHLGKISTYTNYIEKGCDFHG